MPSSASSHCRAVCTAGGSAARAPSSLRIFDNFACRLRLDKKHWSTSAFRRDWETTMATGDVAANRPAVPTAIAPKAT